MERRIFHGNIKPNDIAQALMAEFNRGNLRTQAVGQADKLAIQIATRLGAQSGGQTGLTISIQSVEDGVMVDIGEQAWMGVAASLGQTVISAFRNPFTLLGRLDDLAQDMENVQLKEKVWQTINRTSATLGASHELSQRLRRITCEYCGAANPLGEGSCVACGAPLGDVHPIACPNCGFAIRNNERICPNCNQKF
jgi:DNA-directed RNA polymerase subunit RPC12/RpoP